MSVNFSLNTYWLKSIREFKGISQKKMADLCGRVPSVISEVESGKKTLTMPLFLKYCEVFNMPPVELMSIIQKVNVIDSE